MLDTDLPSSIAGESKPESIVVLSDHAEVGQLVADSVRTLVPNAKVLTALPSDGPLAVTVHDATLCVVLCDNPARLTELVAQVTLLTPDRAVIALLPRSALALPVDPVLTLIRAGATDVLLRGGDYLDQLSIAIRKHRIRRNDSLDRARVSHESALQAALDGIQAENRTLKSLIERFEALAGTDQLTGLPNRRAFDQRLEELFSGSRRYGNELTCLMIDVDQLKIVNDTLGHAAGDELLRIVGQVIAKECRRSDFAARLGGDEFVALLPHTPAAAGRMLASRIQQSLKIRVRPLAARLGILGRGLGVTIGISSSAAPSIRTQADLLIQADDALYDGKNSQRGSVSLSTGAPVTRKAG